MGWLHFCSQFTSAPCIFVLSMCQLEHLYTRTLSWIKDSPQTAAWASQMNLASTSRVNTTAELVQNRSGAGGKLLEARGSWKTESLAAAKHREHCCLCSCLQPDLCTGTQSPAPTTMPILRASWGTQGEQVCAEWQDSSCLTWEGLLLLYL